MRIQLAALLAVAPLFAVAAPDVKASLRDAKGKAIGTATLTQTDGGVRVVVKVQGVTPGPHAFHVHEFGKCEGPDFESAGSHFNPDHREHGTANPKGSHLGDLPNVTVDATGTGTGDFVLQGATLAAGPKSVAQKALVLHAAPDDLKSDPAGNAGDRIACGVIGPQLK
ncbi:MAG: superoxide dismutase family protein [Archangium sp.]|nr:superoxide dismutase family protein [Archangium sp.]MDP3573164.1 superoxide dismutase family protein [Archangium sp.]